MLLPIAHGLPSPPGVPVPGYLFAWSAAGVLLLSFVALGAMWREPRLEDSRARRLFAIPRAVEIGCGAIGVALFALLVYCGLAGTQIGTRNLTPTALYVVVWVGLVPVSAAVGDVFLLFNPGAQSAAQPARSWGDGSGNHFPTRSGSGAGPPRSAFSPSPGSSWSIRSAPTRPRWRS